MPLTKKNVLVVDDSTPIRMKLKSILREMGCKTLMEAVDGKEALAVLADNKVDLVLSDWNMPNLDGRGLVDVMKQTEKLSKIPIIMISTEAEKAGILDLLMRGVSGYIVKPFTDNTVKERILAILNPPSKKLDQNR
jgi:two-component system, chemotaxis family, chemotaxis protein CheY